jgi:Ser/Thr protein kinase RdoA (MazF antagonist)
MAAKLEIATTAHSFEEVAFILSDYTLLRLVQRKQLFGGYSGSNYLVELDDGSIFVLKVSNGYSAEHAELMCRTASHLGKAGYKDCCLPISRINGNTEYEFVSTKEQTGTPSFLLTFVKGKQADKVMRETPNLAPTVMKEIGGGLARMHAAATGIDKDDAETLGLRWYEKNGGCCDVQDQYDGKVQAKIVACEKVQKHEFVEFYSQELAALRTEIQLAKNGKLPHGLTHGDPFADNVLVHAESGELAAFIDVEDFCVGPLLFDLACCAIGCCFKVSQIATDSRYPQVLDMSLFSALLTGYCENRKLEQIEKEHLIAFMRLTLLCNCCWRFVKFNVDSQDDVPEEVKNSYLELQQRIVYLHNPEVIRDAEMLLEDLP